VREGKYVLMVGYIFPPLGGSGVYRMAKFVKYLPQFGWKPVVVSGTNPHVFGTGLDASLVAEVPQEAHIARVPHVSLRGPRRMAKRLVAGRADGPAPRAAAKQGEGNLFEPGSLARKSHTVRTINTVFEPIEFPPIDDAFYWALRIVPHCLRLIRQRDVKVIYTTSFPYSDHLAGLLLRRLTGLPWVADFRDPWSEQPDVRMTGWRRWCDVTAERWVLHRADRIIGVSPTWVADLRALAPWRRADDFALIENGYDEEDFAAESDAVRIQPARPGSALTHVGHAYSGALLPLLRAIEDLGGNALGLRLRFIGRLPEPDAHQLAAVAGNMAEVVEERLPHAEAIREMRMAHALLLLVSNESGWVGHYPGKLFEYLAAGRPILAVGPAGDASRLLEASGAGVRLPTERPEEAAALLRLLACDPDGFRSQYFHPDMRVIARYERRALTARLADVFDELAGKKMGQ
jgi:glycosyltransferase involved in cell wall biosynthesis